MTAREWAVHAGFAYGKVTAKDELIDIVERVIAAALHERTEQCAAICESLVNNTEDWDTSYWNEAANGCAFRIRALD